MPQRKKPSRLQQARQGWSDMSTMAKTATIIFTTIVSASGAYGVGSSMVESYRPWAHRKIETVVAGLQLESLQRYYRDLENMIFQIQLELQKNPRSQFLRDELTRRQNERERLKVQIQKETQGR
jgi:hypothetical protein